MGANEKHRLRILAVEDNPDDAERVVLHLRRAFSVEYKRVEKASDFREAMTEDVWDVILCDYNLPDFNAFKALEIAQSHDENLPFIVVSGTIGESEAIALMDGGARDFVRKDNLSRLIPCIRRELRARDIWFRHLEAGKKLATSERRFRAFIEHTPTPVHLKDIDGRYMIANRPFLSRFEQPEEDILGKTPHDVLSKETADRFQEHDGRIIESKQAETFEEEWEAGSEKHTYMAVRFPVLDHDGRVEAVGSVRFDITDKKRIERNLNLLLELSHTIQKAENFTAAIENTLRLVCETTEWEYAEARIPVRDSDTSGNAHFLCATDPRFEEFHRESRQNRLPGSKGFISKVANDREPIWIEDIAEVSDSFYFRKEKALAFGLRAALGVPIITDTGEVIAVFVFYLTKKRKIDERMTEVIKAVAHQTSVFFQRKQTEDALKESQAALEARVEERTRELSEEIKSRETTEQELRQAKERAEEATRAKSTFLAAMSHEIRTPMNGVIGVLELFRSTGLSREQEEMITLANDSARSLLRVIDDILDFSKIEAGKLEISPEKISVRDIVETVGQNLWLNAQTRNVSILTYIDPRIDSCLLGDPVRISQILINLMGNAVKFTENGTVSASVTVDSEEPDQAVLRFEVSDTGIGMNPDQTAKLFQPFSQVDVSSTRKYGGTGLGLAISRRLTEVMGGEIGVESVRDEGSTFWFCLPLDRLKGQAVKLETPYAGRRILICSRGSRLGGTGITRYLTDFGAECRRVRTVQEATAALAESVAENRPFDLVITQHHFDGEGAGDLVAYMTTQAELRDTPIILYAPRQDAMSETLKRELHFNDVIYRPFVLRQACAAIVRATGWPAPKFLKSSSAPKKQRSRPVYREPSHQAAAEAGALVLIAEDNLTNQIVLKKQLSRLGYAAEFADNGAKAMRLLVQDDKRYGLLLSDCQMPVMDGYELTRRIRAREENNGRHLPIIALTADAMDGTEERCLMAGMDGYLSKPVELAALDDVIGKWLPAADKLRANTMVQETFGAKAGPDLNESNAKMKKTIEGAAPIDKNRLVELIGTDEPEVLRDMLQCFFQTTRDKPAELKRLVETKNAGGLYNAAHAAKGASASVGAGRLADALKDLQDAADAADWPRIEALEPEVTTAFHEVHDAIEEELGKS